ncbi:M20/M25/M40 family metallo-hydrolase [Promicromonospora iranensis]|uniref:Carboxypeptidase PM20D1 n=1 Tax=Promicromonospora iranensis TaxID=1105144 RepID=A0ABU2CNL2_9MICO|nr:M20/M25/M40 family metallo-hydrolase [Promicromonospora iranensis]MDR7382920.1 carboxypeptidase PM20D1 [Promicromonospora iranensis]
MSADIDPTEAIPQVTAEMIAKAAVQPAASPSTEPAPEPRRAEPPAPLSATRPDTSLARPAPDGRGTSDGSGTSEHGRPAEVEAVAPQQDAPQISEQPAAPDAVLADQAGPPAFAPSEAYGEQHASAGHIAAAHLSSLVQIPTVSSWDPQYVDHDAFARHRAALAAFYPRVHALQSEPAGDHGLLYRWPGRGRQDVLHPFPVVLMAHQDVVPVQVADWPANPFSGEIRDGVVHGRGTLDDKGGLVAVLDAVETLLGDGFVPERDVWLFFGADEEAAGESAQIAVRRLYELGVRPWLVIDEGGGVVSDAFPGLDRQTAMVGVAEKGLVGIDLYTSDVGGHAATPGKQSATARLARAVTRVSRHRFPARVSPPTAAMLGRVAPDVSGAKGLGLKLATRMASGPLRKVAAWLLAGGGPEASALVRTTVAVTELEGSAAANAAASSARARLDVRVALGETVDRTVARLRRVIRDKRVVLEVVESSEPSEVSPTDSQQFALLSEAIGASYPDAVVVPYVSLTATGARTFTPISDHVYRFSPFALSRAQRQSIHGVGEHLSVDSLGRGVHFYREVLRKIPG